LIADTAELEKERWMLWATEQTSYFPTPSAVPEVDRSGARITTPWRPEVAERDRAEPASAQALG
jgi:hypothetical protein